MRKNDTEFAHFKRCMTRMLASKKKPVHVHAEKNDAKRKKTDKKGN